MNNDCFAASQQLMPALKAVELLRASAKVLVSEELCPLKQATGRVLAQDLISHRDIPGFDNAAVDGYAFAYANYQAAADNRLPVSGFIQAGDAGQHTLQPGSAVRIMTGAMMPEGADTVVMQEDVELEGERVLLPQKVVANSNCRPRGEDVAQGEKLLSKGHRLRPQDVGMAASIGIPQVKVYRPLKVALFSTGNEILEPGEPLGADSVYDVNRYMLISLLTTMGCEITDLGILKDDKVATELALSGAARNHQVILTSGGVSTGDKDFVAQILREKGDVDFWRLAIKPGRPLAFGSLDEALFIGFPGNPVAVAVCFLRFAYPLLAALAGRDWPEPHYYELPAAFHMSKKNNRREWVRAKLVRTGEGALAVDKHARQGSGILTSLVEGDGLIELAEEITEINEGEIVPFLSFAQYGF